MPILPLSHETQDRSRIARRHDDSANIADNSATTPFVAVQMA